MIKKIIFFETHFIKFYQKHNNKVKGKIQYAFEQLKQMERVPEKFLKHLTGTSGVYEIRIEYQSNVYRKFCCFDKGKLVVFSMVSKRKPKKHLKGTRKGEKINEIVF